MQKHQKQLSIKILVIYMISALLFLTSIDLHIHTDEAAALESHGSAVSISSLASNFLPESENNEITISPDGVLKIKQIDADVLTVFILIAVLLTFLCRSFITRLRESDTLLPIIPFHGTPPLRAPPQ